VRFAILTSKVSINRKIVYRSDKKKAMIINTIEINAPLHGVKIFVCLNKEKLYKNNPEQKIKGIIGIKKVNSGTGFRKFTIGKIVKNKKAMQKPRPEILRRVMITSWRGLSIVFQSVAAAFS